MQALLSEPRVMAGIVALIILFIILLYVSFSGRKQPRRPQSGQMPERRDFTAETVVRELLSERSWRLRPFDDIAAHIGGYKDNSLRRLLVRAGAVRFTSKDGEESWGLLELNRRKLGPMVAKKKRAGKTTKAPLFARLRRVKSKDVEADKPKEPTTPTLVAPTLAASSTAVGDTNVKDAAKDAIATAIASTKVQPAETPKLRESTLAPQTTSSAVPLRPGFDGGDKSD